MSVPLPSAEIPLQILIDLLNYLSQAKLVSAYFLLNRKFGLLFVTPVPHENLIVNVTSF